MNVSATSPATRISRGSFISSPLIRELAHTPLIVCVHTSTSLSHFTLGFISALVPQENHCRQLAVVMSDLLLHSTIRVILLYSVLFCFVLFYCILFCCILFCSFLFYSILLCSVLFCFIVLILLHCTLLCLCASSCLCLYVCPAVCLSLCVQLSVCLAVCLSICV